jgi:hypothetical protein
VAKINLRRSVPPTDDAEVMVFSDLVEIRTSEKINLMSIAERDAAVRFAYGSTISNGDHVLINSDAYAIVFEVKDGNNHS